MLYAIFARDIPDSVAKRDETRERHVAYLKALVDQGRVVLAGPLPAIDSPEPGPAGMYGSLLVIEFESLDEAHEWVANDPYQTDGVFEDVIIKPLIQTVP
ncbi:YciI family protein [Candidatus Rariloculus sp.]|uniref:YciI family protein n=1 Tax=Candidatus Rariloculus sp. TaxID=3101265 RepID=UPI003D0A6C1F